MTAMRRPGSTRGVQSWPRMWAGTTRDVVVQYAPVDVGTDANVMTITVTNPVGTVLNLPVNLSGAGTGTGRVTAMGSSSSSGAGAAS